ncbi:MAG: hypothetical protein GY820_29815, partial [Gammaproteobacteria bacterium]|nr:hypothetical protein [Gammaproteobacteria bacterium]
MLFIEFQRKICLKSGFPDRPLLSSEYRISERDKNESLIKSGKAELYLAFFFYFVSEIKLNKFFQIICGLTEPRPYPMPLQSVPETAAETAKISGYSDKSFRSGAGAAAEVSLIFGYVIAASHENMTDLRRRVFKVFQAATSQIGDCRIRIFFHPSDKKVEGVAVQNPVGGVSDKVFNGDHKTVPIERHLCFCSKFAVRMALPFFDRTGVRIVEGDDAVLYMPLPGNLQQGLLFENVQEAEHYDGFLFPLRRSPQRPDLFLKSFQGGNEHSVENGQPCCPVPFFFQAELPPEPLQLLIILPDGNAVRFRKGPHFIECLENQPD